MSEPFSTPHLRTAVRRAQGPTMAQFFMNGASFATWGVQIPALKSQFAASDAMMSVAMLAVAAGAVVAMKHVGAWVARVGSARALTLSSLFYAATLLAIPLAPLFGVLLAVLAVFGMAMAAFDVAMNVQAANIEASAEHPVMSTMHGMFSIGGMAGAALGGVLIGWGLPLPLHSALVAALLAGAGLWSSGRLLPDADASEGHSGSGGTAQRISPALWVLGTVAFLGLVCEGAMYDWAAIYMRDVAGASLQVSSYGYAAFSTGMAVGRFSADALRRRFSVRAVLSVSAWMGFAGVTLAITTATPLGSLIGLTLMGLGVANFMPFFFLAGSKLPGMSPAAGVAGVARFAYAGMLFGPPIIGAIAHASSLRAGLAFVAVIMGGIALLGIRKVYGIIEAR